MSALEHDHSRDGIRRRLADGPTISYLRDWVYGGIDGAITTFAIVAGAMGAGFSERVALILGIANIVADGFSMAAANYSGTKTERDDYVRLRAVEERHIRLAPEGETEEIRQIFAAKGFDGDDLERAVAVITSDRERWIATMLTEEYGLPAKPRSAWRAALSTFAAFLLCGLVPLLPFMFGMVQPFAMAIGLTAVVFAVIGSIKSAWSVTRWWWSAAETLAIGLAAAGLAFAIGYWVETLV